jgi:hypothetical protein
MSTSPPPVSPPVSHDPEAGRAYRRLPWTELGVEAFAVFLSVLAGFAVTAWLDARHEDELRRQALENFREELAMNREAVAERLPYHTAVYTGFQRVAQGPPPATFAEAARQASYRGPLVVFFQSTALRAADATGALALLDYDTARAVVAAYTLQEALEETQRTMLGAALSPLMFESDNVGGTTAALTTYFGVVVEFENGLLREYDDVLALLAGRLGIERVEADTAGTR